MAESSPTPATPPDEPRRQAELDAYHILDSAPEPRFDDLAKLAAYICGTKSAFISLVDRERQWFKARVNWDLRQTPRKDSLCAHAINHPGRVMVVPDARADPRFEKNPLVTRRGGIRFYAGAPLVTPRGRALGTICATDPLPRKLDKTQRDALQALARQVVALLEMRSVLRDLKRVLAGPRKKAPTPPAATVSDLMGRVKAVQEYLAAPSSFKPRLRGA